ncbi:MAG: hypothetical protein WB729_24895 [Candidatus Sulfotelmatobacter sp.]
MRRARCFARGIRLGLATLFLVHLSVAQDQGFYSQYVAHAFDGLRNPAAANARVLSIWLKLRDYSGRQFAVLPAEQFTAGRATPNGIYLDVSIAADPSVDVTRFFLAHEWGHMVHLDPLLGLSPVGRYQMLLGGKTVEDKADAYAAAFMRRYHYDLAPVLEFLCSIPDTGPADSHSSGPVRAANVARVYGSTDAPSCEQPPSPSDSNLCPGLLKVIAQAGERFKAFKGERSGNGYKSTYMLPGADKCKVGTTVHDFDCRYTNTDIDALRGTVGDCLGKRGWKQDGNYFHSPEEDSDLMVVVVDLTDGVLLTVSGP